MTTRADERAQRRHRRRAAVIAASVAAALAAAVVTVVWGFQGHVGTQRLAAGEGGVTLPSEEEHAPLTAPTAVPTASVAAAGVRVISRIPTTDPVVFVGMDDGYVRLPEVARMLTERHLPVSLFVTAASLSEQPDYFRSIVASGATVEDHTITHPLLTRLSEEGQKQEICGAADTAQRLVGRRPTLFRPPYGAYDAATLQAVHDCGMDTVVLWDAAVNDGHVQYQQGDRLLPGDIVLMHFRKTGVEDLSALLTAIDAAGLRVASLEEYVSRLPAPTALPVIPPRTGSSSGGHAVPTWRSTWVPPVVGPTGRTTTAAATATATGSSVATATATGTATATTTATATAKPTRTAPPPATSPPSSGPPPTTAPPAPAQPTGTVAPTP